MNFFSKKEDALLDEKLRLTKIYLDQQREENSDLREEFASLKELSLRNKLMLDDIMKTANANDKSRETIEKQNEVLESGININQELIIKLEDEINQLKGIKNTYIPTDFQLSSKSEDIQEVLDRAFDTKEIICFRDANGKIWQIIKRESHDEEELENFTEIDEMTINVSLN